MDPRDGRVLAMIGGNNYRKSQFNLAVQGERQPGSSFKPFVLATALEEGIAPGSRLVSKPVVLYAGGTFWSVHNYEGDYLGSIDLSSGDDPLGQQRLRATDAAGRAFATSLRTAHKLGIASPLKSYLSIGLGGQAVNPLEMARAFSAFANGGFRIDGALDRRPSTRDRRDRRQERRPTSRATVRTCVATRPNRSRVLSSNSSAALNTILQGVVNEGTGHRASLPGRPVAGKTGTTENYGDAWFVGYTPQLVTAVWVGYPNKLVPMTSQFHGRPVAGGTFPALIWKDVHGEGAEAHPRR